MARSPKNLKYYSGRFRTEMTSRGLAGATMLAASVLRRKALNTNKAIWYRLDLAKSAAPTQVRASMDFDFMSLEEASDFFRKHHETFPWMFSERELAVAGEAGHMFPCLRDHGEVIGYIKLGLDRVFISDFQRVLCIPNGSAFIYDTFVMPSHRGRGLGSLLVGKTAAFARQREYRSLWSHIPSWNVPSIKAFRRAGFDAVAEVRFLRLFKQEFFCRRSETLPFSIERAPDRSRELQLAEVLAQ